MKKNPMSVWSYPYRLTYYLKHPWKWFHDTYWNWRNWIHRANYGFSYVDVWNFCDWYPRVGAKALRYLADHSTGYPGIEPWPTPDAWREYLHYLSNRLERCANSQDICFGEERNEYKDELDEIMRATYKRKKNEDGSVSTWHELTPEQEELRKKYWAREEEIRNADIAYTIETFKWVGEDLGRLWN